MADCKDMDDVETEDDSEDEQEEEEPESDEEEPAPPPKKKKKENKPRDWKEVKRWQRDNHTDEDIDVFIRKHLDDLNRSAGILSVPGAHKNRVNKYGDFQFRHKWQSSKGKVMNDSASCPLKDRCGCECEAKIMRTSEEVILFFHKAHTAEDHVPEKDKGKFLKFQQKAEIAHAVKIAPLQTASEFLRNVQDSPTKAINHRYKKSVTRLVQKQRREIIAVELDGVTVDNTVGSLAKLAEKIWIVEAIYEHEVQGKCMPLFKTYVIGKQILDQDSTVFLTFSNIFDILNFWRAVGTGYDVQLFGDVTSKASTAALNKLGFGVNMLGSHSHESHFAPLSFSLIPAQCESTQAYDEAYRAIKSAVRYLIRLKLCDKPDCETCRCIRQVRENPKVVAATSTREYIEDKALPIARPLGDNSAAWQKFARDTLGLDSNVCQTHATAIAANNGSHKTHFETTENYNAFYDYVCRIMRCSFAAAGEGLQVLLVEWLRGVDEGRAADWFNEWWCGPVKGRWLLAHGGIAMSGNNQGLESKWRWDRCAISHGKQVRVRVW